MPVAAVGGVPGGHQPTCFQKIRLGFMMGCMIGGATGVLLGGFSAFRMGLRGKEMLIQGAVQCKALQYCGMYTINDMNIAMFWTSARHNLFT
ncbi:unnamed protein product [Heligmosomoides polygyrus]|uniref:Reactive oxygen species modulator 1 n=1 Tax=Heligmosomoides polygyrus TaxID=6339 RepID=A0A183FPC4_HELPZ|nr:unnamed protein product [Heligmosomoides polygyrus]